MDQARHSIKMWRFQGSNILVSAANKTQARNLYRSFMFYSLCPDSFNRFIRWELDLDQTGRWRSYLAQEPMVWVQTDLSEDKLRALTPINEKDARKVIKFFFEEKAGIPVEDLIRFALNAEVETGVLSGVPYYIRMAVTVHGTTEGYVTVRCSLFYANITPELAVEHVDFTFNDPRTINSVGENDADDDSKSASRLADSNLQ